MSNDNLAAYNAAITKVVASMKAVGLQASESSTRGGPWLGIELRTSTGEVLSVNFMDKTGPSYLRDPKRTFGGFTIRFDWDRRGGMGTRRYPARKDGTIDVERLGGDVASYEQRQAYRAGINQEIDANRAALAVEFAPLLAEATKLSGASGAGVFIAVSNDGATPGKLTFKVSGHVSPSRLRAILSLLEATKEA